MSDTKEASSQPSEEKIPADLAEGVLASLRFLYAKARGAAILAKAHAKRHGAPLDSCAERFTRVANEAQRVTPKPLRSFAGSRFGMMIWGILSARATPKFCMEMQDHLARKMILQLRSLSRRAEASGNAAVASYAGEQLGVFEALSKELQAAIAQTKPAPKGENQQR